MTISTTLSISPKDGFGTSPRNAGIFRISESFTSITFSFKTETREEVHLEIRLILSRVHLISPPKVAYRWPLSAIFSGRKKMLRSATGRGSSDMLPFGMRGVHSFTYDELSKLTSTTTRVYITSLNPQFKPLGPRHKILG